MFGLAIGKLEVHTLYKPWPIRSTLIGCWEWPGCQDLAQEQERYVKVTADPKVLRAGVLDLFCILRGNLPDGCFIDLDVTDDPV